MKPIFTVHAGEYLVGEYIERTYRRWNVWVQSKDTGVDLLVTAGKNRKTVTLQVKFSKDFTPSSTSPLIHNRLVGLGWWTHNTKKITESAADFWVFVLPSFAERRNHFIILPPVTLLQRLREIHGRGRNAIQSYFVITRTNRCWETRGLNGEDMDLVALDRFRDTRRDFTVFLNAWHQIEKRLK